MDGKPALDLCDLIVTVFHLNTNQSGDLSTSQRECQISKYIVTNYRDARIQDSCWSKRKTSYQSFREKLCRSNIFLVL